MTKLDDDLKRIEKDNDSMSYKLAIIITLFLAWILIKLFVYLI